MTALNPIFSPGDSVGVTTSSTTRASLVSSPPPVLLREIRHLLSDIADSPLSRRWTLGSTLFLCSFAAMMGPLAYAQHLLSTPRLPFTAAYFGSIGMTLYFAIGVSQTAPPPSCVELGRGVALQRGLYVNSRRSSKALSSLCCAPSSSWHALHGI
jgi:hypothetical protein